MSRTYAARLFLSSVPDIATWVTTLAKYKFEVTFPPELRLDLAGARGREIAVSINGAEIPLHLSWEEPPAEGADVTDRGDLVAAIRRAKASLILETVLGDPEGAAIYVICVCALATTLAVATGGAMFDDDGCYLGDEAIEAIPLASVLENMALGSELASVARDHGYDLED